jgi:hypothetical protein
MVLVLSSMSVVRDPLRVLVGVRFRVRREVNLAAICGTTQGGP